MQDGPILSDAVTASGVENQTAGCDIVKDLHQAHSMEIASCADQPYTWTQLRLYIDYYAFPPGKAKFITGDVKKFHTRTMQKMDKKKVLLVI